MKRDYYDVLGLSRDADIKSIERAFHTLAMKYHPDHSTDPDATERFKEIAEAYAVLSDVEKRRQYDAHGFAGIKGYSREDLFGGLDLGSLFGHHGSLFGDSIFGRFFGGRPAGQTKGANIRVNLVVPLETIAAGGEETVSVEHSQPCHVCEGSGAEPGTQPTPCDQCSGTGQITHSRKEGSTVYQQITTCRECDGRGQTIESPCQSCRGSGLVSRAETLSVKIPRGLDEGCALKIPGRGHPSADPQGPPGDLLVFVESAPDERFERRGPHLWHVDEIGIPDAVLGAKRNVPTLEGNAEVTIPPGTQSGTTLRLRGEGLPYPASEQRGDLYVAVRVIIPTSITQQHRDLFEQLRDQPEFAPQQE